MPSELCDSCFRWRSFKESCHFHWDGKKECSRFMEHEASDERFRAIIDNPFIIK